MNNNFCDACRLLRHPIVTVSVKQRRIVKFPVLCVKVPPAVDDLGFASPFVCNKGNVLWMQAEASPTESCFFDVVTD